MQNRSICLFLTLVAAWRGQPARADDPAAANAEAAREAAFAEKIRPFLATHCFRCHGGDAPKGELSLEKYARAADLLADRQTWEKVQENLRLRTMPPEGESRPPEPEIDQVAGWVRAELANLDCANPRDPGRVTLRRLNRAEYNNTVRDLTGIPFRPADDFPADEVGYGFDNNGDVLSLPPLLVEKYINAAEQIALAAIVLPENARTFRKRLQAEKLDRDNGNVHGEFAVLYSNGGMRGELMVPETGRHLVHVRAYGDQAGPEPVRMALSIDGKQAGEFGVPDKRNEPGTFTAEVVLEAGGRRLEVRFLNDYYKPDDPNPDQRDRNLGVDYVEVEGPLDVARDKLPEPHRRLIFQDRQPDEPFAAAARPLLRRFADRAYRRPVTADELDRLLALVDLAEKDGASFERAMQYAVQAVLVSPHFLFKVEIDERPDDVTAFHPVNDYELATRLSYFLWASLPDDELFQLAADGKLNALETLAAQARRMLVDPKSRALVENFGGQWLTLRNLDIRTPDKKLFPAFDEELRSAMKEETLRFFEGVMREDRSVLEFIDSDYTYVNERLARHYGIEGVAGAEFRKTPLGDGRRGGVIAQASILTITSNPTRTSPVKRGKWVLEQLLGTPPPPPPPAVEELSEDPAVVSGATLRERMEQHRAKSTCASCHARMDPLGFGLENFDGIGAWRDREGEFAIDASGELPDGAAFNGPGELKRVLLAKQADFTRCLSEKMLTYALGRGLETSDRCVVDEIAGKVAGDGHRMSRLIQEVVQSEPFRKRRGQGASP